MRNWLLLDGERVASDVCVSCHHLQVQPQLVCDGSNSVSITTSWILTVSRDPSSEPRWLARIGGERNNSTNSWEASSKVVSSIFSKLLQLLVGRRVGIVSTAPATEGAGDAGTSNVLARGLSGASQTSVKQLSDCEARRWVSLPTQQRKTGVGVPSSVGAAVT